MMHSVSAMSATRVANSDFLSVTWVSMMVTNAQHIMTIVKGMANCWCARTLTSPVQMMPMPAVAVVITMSRSA